MIKLTVVLAVLVIGFVNARATKKIEQYDTSKYEIIYSYVYSSVGHYIESIYIIRT